MASPLYLTADEKKLFAALPKNLQEGWQVEEEKGTMYESVRQIAMRYQMADFSAYPGLKKIGETMKKGGDISSFSLDDIPAEALKELYFTMGARGVKSLILTFLTEVKNDADIEALSVLSIVRHKLLELNSTASHR